MKVVAQLLGNHDPSGLVDLNNGIHEYHSTIKITILDIFYRESINYAAAFANLFAHYFTIGPIEPGLSPDCGSTRKSQTDWLICEAEMISIKAYSPVARDRKSTRLNSS